ncbi:GGDEF domain-containing protein [Methylobacterium sp. WL30]|uniref:GGDEF domain-containing protein n=1 Tax=unclassified Methylobacterium TaxID=2615210 RepID=UPI0011C840D6|nr:MULTISPECIES: GGDEF domain-containing protein [unclassified Methylobacterium]RZK87482.1 MAG: GGDEF domain-containing protein [Methylobacterium sp.]TXM91202.1 GGDEF domain-containing protein [Methylobacterium sp. WL116]TXN39418.1 GGDEF domain-containing protein [Methylobacterium sp. WL93]TXN51201.1 GGDEF domain-containing protein [Methylobacterium sp. WL119]TXN69409.1 GGDEF domain-containing protein [Methylobacterium sp. WL30]
MTRRLTSRQDLPDDVQTELVFLLYSSLPQVAILAITVSAASLAFALATGGLVEAALGALASAATLCRVASIRRFKRTRTQDMTFRVARACGRTFGAMMVGIGICLALLAPRAAAIDRLDFFILFFGIILSFCVGAATRSSVIPWIPVTTAYIMLIACIVALTRRPEFGCWFGGWFLILMLVAYAEACLHLEGTVIDKILARRAVAWTAAHDGLTGLPNRASFGTQLDRACRRPGGTGEPCAVLYLDLDRFKSVNDTMGHAAGDTLLARVADRLRQAIEGQASAYRLGGDEFAVLLEVDATPERARALASRIVAEVGRPYRLSGGSAEIGISVGIAHAPEVGADPQEVLNRADRALYAAKGGGRGRWIAADHPGALAA